MRLKGHLLIPLLLLPLSCNTLTDYNGQYNGSLSSDESLRSGFTPDTTLALSIEFFDEFQAQGTITTSDGIFQSAQLSPISVLSNDRLATLNFEGDGFNNYVFAVKISAGLHQGAYALAILSLLDDQKLELRIIYGPDLLFGVFSLR